MSQLDRNTATLNELLELAQNLPEAGTALPELSNPGTAADLLAGKELIDGDGNIIEGAMPSVIINRKQVTWNYDEDYANLPVISSAGYADDNALNDVGVHTTDKTVTPTKTRQIITGSDPKDMTHTNDPLLRSVTVNPIPSNYQNVSGVTATADKVLSGSKYVNSSGTVVTGTMANRGAVNATVSVMSGGGKEIYTIPKGYHSGSGTVAVDPEVKTTLASVNGNTAATLLDAVENVGDAVDTQASLISQIQTALEGKAAGGGGAAPETCTVVINVSGGYLTGLIYQEFADNVQRVKLGAVSIASMSPNEPDIYFDDTARSITIQNVVLGSPVVVTVGGMIIGMYSYNIENGSMHSIFTTYGTASPNSIIIPNGAPGSICTYNIIDLD